MIHKFMPPKTTVLSGANSLRISACEFRLISPAQQMTFQKSQQRINRKPYNKQYDNTHHDAADLEIGCRIRYHPAYSVGRTDILAYNSAYHADAGAYFNARHYPRRA